jgi:uncharacterized membrane protein YjjB (DUF3815 family)
MVDLGAPLLSTVVDLILAFVGAVVPAYLFKFDGRRWPLVGLSGLFGWGVYLAGTALGWGAPPALFAGACTVGLWSELVARLVKSPVPSVLVGGVFPLVPGLTAFQALEALLRHKDALAGEKGGAALAAAVAVALGILTVAGLTRLVFVKSVTK